MASPKLAHLIINTSNYEAMKLWYLNVLDATIGVETSDHSACFLRTDESHHRFGMFNVVKTDDSGSMTQPGSRDETVLSRMNHVSFEYPGLAELLEKHGRLAESSVTPGICLNHGATMSMYYEDPDRNTVELFYDTGFSEQEIIDFYAGGDRYVLSATPFDPAEMLRDLRSGKTVAELTAWSPPSE
jgi:catechol-2,3-dioxygenase